MSGPVWKFERADGARCSECGRQVEGYRAVGLVIDSIFVPSRRYCDDCYEALGKSVDQVA